MKISHSASPRNRSSRNSRSPAAGSVTAGVATEAAVVPAVARASVSATGSPAIGSAMDVIGHRFWPSDLRELHDTTDHIGPQVAGNARNARYGERDRAGGALGRNCVE